MILILAVLFSISLYCVNSYTLKGYTFRDSSGCGDEIFLEPLPNLKFFKHADSYYYIGSVYMGNFWQALQFCHLHDMKLVSIETKEENDFISNSLDKIYGKQGNSRFWTSGTRLPDGTNYIWLATGLPVTYANWDAGNPSRGGEHCVEVVDVPGQSSSIIWNDCDCSWPRLPICETNVNRTITNALTNQNKNYNITFLDVQTSEDE